MYSNINITSPGATSSSGFDLEKLIAVLYVYLLPIRMITAFAWLRNALPGAAGYIDFFLHIIGLTIYLSYSHRKNVWQESSEEESVLSFIKLIIYLNCSSILMAVVIQVSLGSHGGENAFSGIAGMLIYFSQYALMVIYNKRVLELISRDLLEKIWDQVCLFLLILGYWQVACMTIGGFFSTTYDAFNVLGCLYNSNMPKLCLTGSEGASAGSLISIFVLPYLFSHIITQKNFKKYLIQVILWLVPLFFMKSSTAYILFVICCSVFLWLYLRNHNYAKLFLLISPILIAGGIVLMFSELLPDFVREEINYLLLEKISDNENGSTVSRAVPLLMNWGAFTEWPIFGVGNGLQGYFYEKYFPEWAYDVPGSDVLEFLAISRTGIGNGAIFLPSLLSGYGIVGCIVIFSFIRKYAQMVSRKKAELGHWYFQFLIAAACILVSGFQGDFYGKYYLWFVLCIPLMPGLVSGEPISTKREE